MEDHDNIPRNALGQPVNQDDDPDKPIPFELDPPPAKAPPAGNGVSRKPLNLGGPAVPAQKPAPPAAQKPAAPAQRPAAPAQKPAAPAQKPAAPKIQVNKPPVRVAPAVGASGDRITGIKTFYTKLHPGAIPFMDEQINDWLKANPGVRIKHTNTVVGEVQAKKTEPNIIITIWY